MQGMRERKECEKFKYYLMLINRGNRFHRKKNQVAKILLKANPTIISLKTASRK